MSKPRVVQETPSKSDKLFQLTFGGLFCVSMRQMDKVAPGKSHFLLCSVSPCPGCGMRWCPSRPEITMPIITIQIRRSFAVASETAQFGMGSNRNVAKIRAAAIVPKNPAAIPNRSATISMKARKRNGRMFLKELAWKNNAARLATTMQDAIPTVSDTHRRTSIS